VLGKLTLEEGSTQISYTDRFLDTLASPFAHETGFYFKGRKQYTIQSCAGCTVFCIFILLIAFLYLFIPVFGGQIVASELERVPFNTPAGIPLYNNEDGVVSRSPGFLAQLYGRKQLN
jgi:hypothetical protein